MIISVPATSANLGPGFDSLGLSLDFRNTFYISPSSMQSIKISGEGEDFYKLKTDNAFVKIFSTILGDQNLKFSFEFENKIPISRGMGSSSAVISAAITAAHYFRYGNIDKQQVLNTALYYEPHPDNLTPAIFGGFNVAVLERNKVVHTKFEVPDEIRAIMVVPNRSMSTKYSRQKLPKKYSTQDSIYNLSRSSLMVAAFSQRKWDLLRIASKDKFHQYSRMKQFPILFAVQKLALEKGALMSALSGSGSSFINICHKDDCPQIFQALSERFKGFRVLDLGFDNDGLRVEQV